MLGPSDHPRLWSVEALALLCVLGRRDACRLRAMLVDAHAQATAESVTEEGIGDPPSADGSDGQQWGTIAQHRAGAAGASANAASGASIAITGK